MGMSLLIVVALAMTRPRLRGGQRGDAPAIAGPSTGILTETSDFIVTEAGDFLVQE